MSPAPSPPRPGLGGGKGSGPGLCAVSQRVAPADTMLADTITVTREPREKPFSRPFFPLSLDRSNPFNVRDGSRFFLLLFFFSKIQDHRSSIERKMDKLFSRIIAKRGRFCTKGEESKYNIDPSIVIVNGILRVPC